METIEETKPIWCEILLYTWDLNFLSNVTHVVTKDFAKFYSLNKIANPKLSYEQLN